MNSSSPPPSSFSVNAVTDTSDTSTPPQSLEELARSCEKAAADYAQAKVDADTAMSASNNAQAKEASAHTTLAVSIALLIAAAQNEDNPSLQFSQGDQNSTSQG